MMRVTASPALQDDAACHSWSKLSSLLFLQWCPLTCADTMPESFIAKTPTDMQNPRWPFTLPCTLQTATQTEDPRCVRRQNFLKKHKEHIECFSGTICHLCGCRNNAHKPHIPEESLKAFVVQRRFPNQTEELQYMTLMPNLSCAHALPKLQFSRP